MKVISRNVYDAYEWNPEDVDGSNAVKALLSGVDGGQWFTEENGKLSIHRGNRWFSSSCTAKTGDFIVINSYGTATVISKNNFHNKYTEVSIDGLAILD